MSPSTAEFAIVVVVFALTLGWALRRFRMLRYAAAVVVLANTASFVFAEDPGTADQPSPTAEAAAEEESSSEASDGAAEPTDDPSDDGGRNWGSDDGIATTLQPKSKIVLGIGFVITLGLVIWLVSYQKPDGAAYPDDEG